MGATTSVRRLVAAVLTAALCAGLLLLAPAAPATAEPRLAGLFSGRAYGTTGNAKLGEGVASRLGRSAALPCPCLGTDGETRENTETSTSEEGVVESENMRSTARTTRRSQLATVRMANRTADPSAFEGMLTARSVVARANVDAGTAKIRADNTGSSVSGLVVDGEPIGDVRPGEPPIEVAGVARIEFFDTSKRGDGRARRSVSVDALTITLLRGNPYGLPAGAKLVIGHATAGFQRDEPLGVLRGEAFISNGKSAREDTDANSGRSAYISYGCRRAVDGKTRRNRINSLDLGALGGAGSGVTTGYGGPNPNAPGLLAKSTSRVESLELAGGAITADSLLAEAKAAIRPDGRKVTSPSMRFVNLRVLGERIDDRGRVAPDTEIPLPGIGRVIVNRQRSRNSAEGALSTIVALRLEIAEDNTLGLRAGVGNLGYAAAEVLSVR